MSWLLYGDFNELISNTEKPDGTPLIEALVSQTALFSPTQHRGSNVIVPNYFPAFTHSNILYAANTHEDTKVSVFSIGNF